MKRSVARAGRALSDRTELRVSVLTVGHQDRIPSRVCFAASLIVRVMGMEIHRNRLLSPTCPLGAWVRTP
jgi:hypothetical protein